MNQLILVAGGPTGNGGAGSSGVAAPDPHETKLAFIVPFFDYVQSLRLTHGVMRLLQPFNDSSPVKNCALTAFGSAPSLFVTRFSRFTRVGGVGGGPPIFLS